MTGATTSSPVRRLTLGEMLSYIAANVRRLREGRGLTQEALGEAIGRDFRAIQRVESGRHAMNVRVLVSLANALDVEPAELLRPGEMPEIRRGRPRKVRTTEPATKAAREPVADAPAGPTAPAAPTAKRISRKASTPLKTSTGRTATDGDKAGRKRPQ